MRFCRVIFCLYVAVWLGIIVPGHRVLEASVERAAVSKHAGHDTPVPHQHDDAHCLICLHAGGVPLPEPAAQLIVTPEVTSIRPERAPPAPVVATLPTPIVGRAPPAA